MEKPVDIFPFDPGPHLGGVLDILTELDWDNFRYDPDLTGKSLTAPGVTTLVAVSGGQVAGFAQVFGDGLGLQTHLSLLAVGEEWRRRGIAGMLIEEAFRKLGSVRMDLIASDESVGFYGSLKHRRNAGFRLYPGDTDDSGRRG